MGMDVYGTNPTNEVGSYFRRNVWGWRPLWNYCLDVHNEIAGAVQYGHSNDGDGLDGTESLKLANAILSAIADGTAQDYISQRNAYLAGLPRLDCDLCEGTGIRADEVGVQNGMPERELSAEMSILLGRTIGWCNGCNGEGKKESWETNYDLELDDLKEFAEFLKNCGGFEIH
jgi:hypothetical protein